MGIIKIVEFSFSAVQVVGESSHMVHIQPLGRVSLVIPVAFDQSPGESPNQDTKGPLWPVPSCLPRRFLSHYTFPFEKTSREMGLPKGPPRTVKKGPNVLSKKTASNTKEASTELMPDQLGAVNSLAIVGKRRPKK